MLTTKEVSRLCEVPLTSLTVWVSNGHIKPAKRGGIGKGNTHRFSPQQAICIAVASALHHFLRCSGEYVGRIVADAERYTIVEMTAWMSGESTPWDEEETAAAATRLHPFTLLPGQVDLAIDIVRRVKRVLAHLQAQQRISPASGRRGLVIAAKQEQ